MVLIAILASYVLGELYKINAISKCTHAYNYSVWLTSYNDKFKYNIALDVHTVAIINAAEDYGNIREGFRDFINAVNNYISHPHITIGDVEYQVQFVMCSDYKVCNYR